MAFSTDRSLLSKIQKGDEIGWHDFYLTYSPLIYLRGGDHELTETERQELTQEVLLTVFKNCGKFNYDKTKGRFRSYLRVIIDRRAIDIIRKRNHHESMCCYDESQDEIDQPIRPELEQMWEREWESHLLNQAYTDLRRLIDPVTYQAFELYAISGWEPKKVAKFLDLSVNSVYVAKNRAINQLKTIIVALKAEENKERTS